MCGIAGIVDWDADLTRSQPELQAMSAALAHRGPDADGAWCSPPAALLHRRLVVVDPVGGAQPMVWHQGERLYILTYNGELYNTPELRAELLARGHRFRGHSDTEVLLAACVEWGPAAVERLNGIFAFAVWDATAQRLFLARDRLGVKPLFYARRGSALLFASELKALLAHPAVAPEVDAEGLAEVLVTGPARTPGHGVFRGVDEVLPGGYVVYDRNGPRSGRYWSLPAAAHAHDLDTTVAAVGELLADAARRQLVSDVPLCTLLSGGLDSSALTALAARAYGQSGQPPLHTFAIDYVGNEQHFRADAFQPDPDAPWARRMSHWLGTVHHEVRFTSADLAAALVPATQARDLPGMADVDSALYLFCREIKRTATVALSGECADEVFGGYPWVYRDELWHDDAFPWTHNLDQRMRLFDPGLVARLRPRAYMAERFREALAEVPPGGADDPAERRRRQVFYLNLTRWMPVLLDRKDRMSMAHGLEVRVPFCDHRLVEYVWNVPWALKYCDGREKGLLRRALADVLPEDVRIRRKSPFPKTHNPAYLDLVRRLLAEVLDDPSSPLASLVDRPALDHLLRSAGTGSSPDLPWFGQLMRVPQLLAHLLQVDTWLRTYQVRLVGV